jgi:hypothetical protein
MDADKIMAPVCRALDVLVEVGTQYQGLFPSLLDRKTHRMLEEMPPAIEGQRQGDRSHLGSNLIHDQTTLKTMYALGESLGRPTYTAAADRYLSHFAQHCSATPSGLFPWGEHAYWDLRRDRVGDSAQLARPERPYEPIHDHLRQAPLWLLERLAFFNPACIQGLADGLDNHWTVGEGYEYIRHAFITRSERYPRGARSCDFPRHGGFYCLNWAYAWQQGGKASHWQQIRCMLDYWWTKRGDDDLLLIESRTPTDNDRFYQINAPGQTLSLAASLLEAAPLLAGADEPELAQDMHQRAKAYIAAFLRAPHDPARGVFSILSRCGDASLFQAMPVWGSVYGVWPASYVALTALCAYRLTGTAALLDWAAAVGRCYAIQSMPAGVAVPAMDAGLGLGLLADLYEITAEEHWLESAGNLALSLLPNYMDADLPRGAQGIDWYESQMGPSFLLHGLARTALMLRSKGPCPLEPDYTAR